MAFTVKDRTKESSSTTGTGAITLSGAPSNYQTFNTAVGVGNNCWYCINNLSANEWEVGYGQLTASTTLTRLKVFSGTNGTSFVNFSAGTKEVFVTLPAAFNNQTLGRTNMIINPHGSIQQETTTPVTTDQTYFADQWLAVFVASTAAFQAGVTTGAVSSYDPSHMFYKTTTAKGSLAAGDLALIDQRIEGSYVRRLLYGGSSAKGSWLRWRASASQSATCSVALGNAAGDRSFVQTFAVTTTPTDYFLFVPGDTTGTWPTSTAQGAQVTFCFAAGTTYQTSTLGSWQAGLFVAANTQTNLLGTLNAQLNITDVQWSASDVLLPFEPIDYQQELARCQRYFYKNVSVGNTVVLGVGVAESGSIVGVNLGSNYNFRVKPSLTFSNVKAFDGSTVVTVNSISTDYSTPQSTAYDLNLSAGLVVGRATSVFLDAIAGANIAFSARM